MKCWMIDLFPNRFKHSASIRVQMQLGFETGAVIRSVGAWCPKLVATFFVYGVNHAKKHLSTDQSNLIS